MPKTITQQPSSAALYAAYRPIVFKLQTDQLAAPIQYLVEVPSGGGGHTVRITPKPTDTITVGTTLNFNLAEGMYPDETITVSAPITDGGSYIEFSTPQGLPTTPGTYPNSTVSVNGTLQQALTGGAPPVAYCDIYIDGAFFRTLEKTVPQLVQIPEAIWEFDIQDALQEFLTSRLGAIHGNNIETVDPGEGKCVVFCRFRSSLYNADGFIESDELAPIQGTEQTEPVAGNGLESNHLVILNATLQHEDNDELTSHLASFRTGTWHADVYPLTHRYNGCEIGYSQSNFFPLICNNEALTPACIKIFYRLKNSDSYLNSTSCGAAPACTPAELPVAASWGDMTVGVPWSVSIPLTAGTAPITLDGTTGKPSWMTVEISGTSVLLSGTPDAAGTTNMNIEVSNACGSDDLDLEFTVGAAPTCEPIQINGGAPFALPSGTVGVPYAVTIPASGTAGATYSDEILPPWMTVTTIIDFSGNITGIQLTGTPDEPSTDEPVSFTAENACGSADYDGTITIMDEEDEEDYNLLVTNDATTGQIDDVTPPVFLVVVDSFPVFPGGNQVKCTQGGGTVAFSVDYSACTGQTLRLLKNSSIMQSTTVTGSGTFTFTSITFTNTDNIEILLEN